jgi:hypothetical protein
MTIDVPRIRKTVSNETIQPGFEAGATSVLSAHFMRELSTLAAGASAEGMVIVVLNRRGKLIWASEALDAIARRPARESGARVVPGEGSSRGGRVRGGGR